MTTPGQGTFRFRADVNFRTQTANDAVNTPELVQPALALLRASLSYTLADGRLSFALFGSNLTNERYIISGIADEAGFGGAELNAGRPREWGLTVSAKF